MTTSPAFFFSSSLFPSFIDTMEGIWKSEVGNRYLQRGKADFNKTTPSSRMEAFVCRVPILDCASAEFAHGPVIWSKLMFFMTSCRTEKNSCGKLIAKHGGTTGGGCGVGEGVGRWRRTGWPRHFQGSENIQRAVWP